MSKITENQRKYMELIIKKGINIQKGQYLVITSPVESYEFTRELTKIAYECGAGEVVVNWGDEIVDKYKYHYGKLELFSEFPAWKKSFFEETLVRGGAVLNIYSSDPDLLKDVDKEKISTFNKTKGLALRDYYDRVMGNEVQWCVVSVPTTAWSKKIFPNLDEEKAMEKLWELILNITRADRENPILAWEEHLLKLRNVRDYLNSMNFDKLIYKNSNGTDLEIGLPEGHIWVTGKEKNKNGVEFVANIPTEEIFTMPHRDRVNGTVVSTKPLIYGGNMIDKFRLVFKDGKVVEYSAEVGETTLEKLLNIDENSKFLGEVALVEDNSPISNTDTVFFNTLFDENASCHLAFGQAYSVCIKDGDKLSEKEMAEKGVNVSITHEDFMIGNGNMEIIGVDKNGDKVMIMKNGNYCI